MRFKGIKLMRQYDANDCGIACIKMLAKYYDIDPNLYKGHTLKNLTQNGISISGLIEGGALIGLSLKAFCVSLKQLQEKVYSPAILFFPKGHFVLYAGAFCFIVER